jgi:signal transduction histidine kinase
MLGFILAAVLAVAVVLLARYAATQRRALHERHAELRAARERTTALSLLEERAKIARELHDVVTHRLSLIALQAQGALQEPEQGAPALRAIRQAAEEGLEEMRSALELLRDEDAEPELEPQPGLAQLPALVGRAREAGMPVSYLVEGRPRAIPAGLDLAAYRIVQEALVNAHRHAGGAPASVRVGWRDGSLALQIRDTGHRAPSDAEDEELLGMRERVKAHGGDFRAGRVPGGGYEVVARLPL